MKNRTSSNYVFTFDRGDVDGMNRLKAIREQYAGSDMRVCIKGRLGKNNPAAATYKAKTKYKRNAYQTINLADASRFDVYVYMR